MRTRICEIDTTDLDQRVASRDWVSHPERVNALLGVPQFRNPILLLAEYNWRSRGRWRRRYIGVADGNHRLEAARQQGWLEIDAEVVDFWFYPHDARPRNRR